MLDEKELLPMFIQVLSELVSVDSSNKPLIGDACGIQRKCKKDEDDDNDVLQDICQDLKGSFLVLEKRASAEKECSDTATYTDCVSAYNAALEASSKNKAKIAEYKMCILQMQSEGQPKEHLEPLVNLIAELHETASNMMESSQNLQHPAKRQLAKLEALFGDDEDSVIVV